MTKKLTRLDMTQTMEKLNQIGSLLLTIGAIVGVYVTMNNDIALLKKEDEIIHEKYNDKYTSINNEISLVRTVNADLMTRTTKLEEEMAELNKEMDMFMNIQSQEIIKVKNGLKELRK